MTSNRVIFAAALLSLVGTYAYADDSVEKDRALCKSMTLAAPAVANVEDKDLLDGLCKITLAIAVDAVKAPPVAIPECAKLWRTLYNVAKKRGLDVEASGIACLEDFYSRAGSKKP
jgi:hypothetical protein